MSEAISILFQDEHCLVANKPAGCETIVKGTQGRCLTSELRRAEKLPCLQPAHRLDRDTTGVQIFAKTETALAALEETFRTRAAQKQYLALCLGVPRNPTGMIRRNLSKWSGGRRPVRVVKGKGGLIAETEYDCVFGNSEFDWGADVDTRGVSLLRFRPHHGRTHQVRVHAAAFGYPLLGDDNYGDRPANKAAKRMTGLTRYALHAWRLCIPHPVTKKAYTFEAPLHTDMVAALDTLLPGWQAVLRDAGESHQ